MMHTCRLGITIVSSLITLFFCYLGCGEKMMIEDGQSSLMRDALFPMRQKESLTEIRRAVKNKLSLSAVKDTEDTIWEL